MMEGSDLKTGPHRMAPLSPRDPTDHEPPQDTPVPVVTSTPPEETAQLHLRAADILENISDAVLALG